MCVIYVGARCMDGLSETDGTLRTCVEIPIRENNRGVPVICATYVACWQRTSPTFTPYICKAKMLAGNPSRGIEWVSFFLNQNQFDEFPFSGNSENIIVLMKTSITNLMPSNILNLSLFKAIGNIL